MKTYLFGFGQCTVGSLFRKEEFAADCVAASPEHTSKWHFFSS
jgi:hypothetical protein